MSPDRSALSLRNPLVLAPAALVALALLATGPLPAQDSERAVVSVEDETDTVSMEMKRLVLPSLSAEVDAPYSAVVPLNWYPRRDIAAPGVFLGPASGNPESHPEMLLVRESDVDVSDPEAILSNLRANAEAGEWALVEGEVRDFGGAQGLWIVRRLPPQGLHGERINMAVKLPLDGNRSLDVTSTLPVDQWTGVLGQQVEHMLASIEPAEPAAPEAEPEGE
jgi:hypothetical protein